MANPRVVLVTGASSGIGEAIAVRLAKDGHQVFGTSRKGGGMREGVEMLDPGRRSDASVQSCVEGLLRKVGRIDALVNNAGYLLSGAIEEATLEEARAQFETNFFGVARMVKVVLPAMRRARSGHIVTISSLAGLVPVPFWGFYNASKFAVEGYMETLRHELKPFGIRVAMVEPGVIHTPFYENPQARPMPEYAPWRDRALKTVGPVRREGPRARGRRRGSGPSPRKPEPTAAKRRHPGGLGLPFPSLAASGLHVRGRHAAGTSISTAKGSEACHPLGRLRPGTFPVRARLTRGLYQGRSVAQSSARVTGWAGAPSLLIRASCSARYSAIRLRSASASARRRAAASRSRQ